MASKDLFFKLIQMQICSTLPFVQSGYFGHDLSQSQAFFIPQITSIVMDSKNDSFLITIHYNFESLTQLKDKPTIKAKTIKLNKWAPCMEQKY